MNISYQKLWELLIDRGINKSSLQKIAHTGAGSITKLVKNENVNTDTLVKICKALDCDIIDIMEMVREPHMTEKKQSDVAYEDNISRIAVSLFSGAGGMDIGVRQAGFNVVSCTEIDKNCCDTLRNAITQNGFQTQVFEGDIRSSDALEFAIFEFVNVPVNNALLSNVPVLVTFAVIFAFAVRSPLFTTLP